MYIINLSQNAVSILRATTHNLKHKFREFGSLQIRTIPYCYDTRNTFIFNIRNGSTYCKFHWKGPFTCKYHDIKMLTQLSNQSISLQKNQILTSSCSILFNAYGSIMRTRQIQEHKLPIVCKLLMVIKRIDDYIKCLTAYCVS